MWIARALRLLLGLMITLFCTSAVIAGSAPFTVMDALPTEASFEPGWKREITLLFDPSGKPTEIARTNLSESLRN
jgi:hypothetical protein